MKFLLTHPDMRNSFFNIFWIPLFIVGYWLSPARANYSEFMIATDFAIVVASTLYLFVIKPLIYTGKIIAFYPNEYHPKIRYFSVIYSSYAAVSFGRLLPHVSSINFLNIDNHTHPYAIFGYVVSIALFFLLYYASWYVPIKRFDAGVKTIMFAPSDRFGDFKSDPRGASYVFLNNYEVHKRKHGSEIKQRKIKKMKESVPNIEDDAILSDMFRMEIEKTQKVNEAEIRKEETIKRQGSSIRRQNREEI